MLLELEQLTLPAQANVKIEVSVTSTINVTAKIAQRKVSKLLLDQVGNLLYGEQPNLVAGQRLLWRVPVYLGLPTTGCVGQVGTIDVDAQTGELLFTQQILDEIGERGDALAERATHRAS
jgi:hypothetical protein